MTTTARRFYKTVSLTTADAVCQLQLDARPAKTKRQKPLTFPTQALGRAVAAEWEAQRETIHPDSMPLTRFTTIALDIIGDSRGDVAGEILAYGQTDLLCYRADNEPALLAEQTKSWDPIVQWARQRFDIGIDTTLGIMPIPQPASLTARLERQLATYDDFHFAALAVTTHLTGSLVLALALVEKHLSAAQVFHAATIDEQFQCRQWGETEEQRVKKRQIQEELQAIEAFLQLLQA